MPPAEECSLLYSWSGLLLLGRSRALPWTPSGAPSQVASVYTKTHGRGRCSTPSAGSNNSSVRQGVRRVTSQLCCVSVASGAWAGEVLDPFCYLVSSVHLIALVRPGSSLLLLERSRASPWTPSGAPTTHQCTPRRLGGGGARPLLLDGTTAVYVRVCGQSLDCLALLVRVDVPSCSQGAS